jgi:hypothetical protein
MGVAKVRQRPHMRIWSGAPTIGYRFRKPLFSNEFIMIGGNTNIKKQLKHKLVFISFHSRA